MTDPHPRHSPANRLALRSILGLGLMAALVACSPATPTPITAGPTTDASAPTTEASSPSGGASTTPPAGQTDTDWGRIWDTVPAGFPVYPGATLAEEVETGPVSATFALEGDHDLEAIATWMQTELERATYRTEALNGPLEDGSFVLESIGSAPDCRVEVVVAPLGGLVTMTVRYGAACPTP